MRRSLAAACVACAPTLPAWADCARLSEPDDAVIVCDGIDVDGYSDLRPFLNVTVSGDVLGADAALALGFGSEVQVVASGEITGVQAGLSTLGALDLANFGKVVGLEDAAVSAGSFSSILNAGDLRGLAGAGVVASNDLSLTNMAGRISNVGGGGVAAVMVTGDATVTNQNGGEIDSQIGGAIRAASTLTLRNGVASEIRSGLGDAVSASDALDARNDGVIESERGAALSATGGAKIENRLLGVIRSLGTEPALDLTGPANSVTNRGQITAAQGAVSQAAGTLTLRNGEGGAIRSTQARAVSLRNGTVVNAADAAIEGALGGVRIEAGRVENAGRIAAETGAAIAADTNMNRTDTLVIENSGVISGVLGIDVAQIAAAPQIFNTGVIEGTGGVAIRFAPERDPALLTLDGGSAIFGDVLFGDADDTLRIGELTSGVLINSVFDGGGGDDLAAFTARDPGAVVDVTFLEPTTVALTLLAANGEALTGAFANFEMFRFGDVDIAFTDLGELTPAPIPLPAAAPLLLAGLAGLAATARRRAG